MSQYERAFCISPNLDKLLYLIESCERLGYSVDGTKKIQRLTWLAKVNGVEFSYDFESKHWWPPHDDRLDTDINVLCNLDLVRAELQVAKFKGAPHVSHSYTVTDYGRSILERHIKRRLPNPSADKIADVVRKYGGYTDAGLTLCAFLEYQKISSKA